MRALVVVLAILAGTKIWAHDMLFRAASEQALLKAYAHRAVTACQRINRMPTATSGVNNKRVMPRKADWSRYALAKVVMGDPTLDVALWQVDHKLWDQRYKTPFIHLNVGNIPARYVCTYNITTGRAVINRA